MPSVGSSASRCAEKNRARQKNSCLALSGTFRPFPRVGQVVSLEETAKIKCTKKLQITKENHRNQVIPVIFGGDYWTRTSDLLRMKNCVAVAINLGVVFSTSGCFIYAIAQASSSLFRALK